jgi:hypothetical protein
VEIASGAIFYNTNPGEKTKNRKNIIKNRRKKRVSKGHGKHEKQALPEKQCLYVIYGYPTTGRRPSSL